MISPMAIVRLMDPAKAPGYRAGLAERGHFSVTEFGDDTVGVVPAEGAGVVAPHFELVKLADAQSDLTDAHLLAPIRDHPPRTRSSLDPDAYMAEMEQRAKEIQERVDGVHADLVATALMAFGAIERGEVDELVAAQLPALFEVFPDGSLWYVKVSDVLLGRLAFGRTQLAMSLLPDLPVGPDMDRLSSMEDLTLTKGVDVSSAINAALLLLSPAVLGFQIPATPHALVFCFGKDIDLRLPYPQSLASLYRPRVLQDAVGLVQTDFLKAAEPADGERLLSWWLDQLNIIYSHATDPTRFTDDQGFYDPDAQTAWLISVERLIGDLISLLAEPQATDLDRIQVAFDLLDKAETLLGYGRKDTSKGFTALLRRGRSAPAVIKAYESMPADLAERLATEARRLFDTVYDEILDDAVAYRRTPTGVHVDDGKGRLAKLDNDTYVSRLIRAVRNTSHGLIDVLREHPDRYLLATNTGGIPAAFPALAAMIGIAILADIPAVIEGSFRKRLAGHA